VDILVTGAGSKAGAEIVRSLAATGARVRVTSHLQPQGRESVVEVAADYLRPETLDAAFAGIDAAVLITPEDPGMVTMTANLVAAAEDAAVRRLVLLSFILTDGMVGGPLLAWHRGAEDVVRRSRIPSTCLRPNYYMQNFLSAYTPAASLEGGRVSYVDARDVAEVAVKVLLEGGHDGMAYSLTGPRALAMAEVMDLLGSGHETPVYAKSWEDTCERARRSSLPPLTEALCEFWQAAGEDQFAATTPTVAELTGHPPTDFVQFVREHRGQLWGLRGRARDGSAA